MTIFRTCKERATYGFSLLAILTLPLSAQDIKVERTFPYFQIVASDSTPLVELRLPPLPPDKKCKPDSNTFCIDQVVDWSRVFESDSMWTFRIDGENYSLTGKDLIELIKRRKREEVNSKEKKP